MPNIGVQVINVTFRNVAGTVTPTPTMAASMSTTPGLAQQTTTAKSARLSDDLDGAAHPQNSAMRVPPSRIIRTARPAGRGDPTFLTDAAGTFVCFKNRPCSVVLDGVRVTHANTATRSPPAWLCGNTTVAVGAGGVKPPLSGGC